VVVLSGRNCAHRSPRPSWPDARSNRRSGSGPGQTDASRILGSNQGGSGPKGRSGYHAAPLRVVPQRAAHQREGLPCSVPARHGARGLSSRRIRDPRLSRQVDCFRSPPVCRLAQQPSTAGAASDHAARQARCCSTQMIWDRIAKSQRSRNSATSLAHRPGARYRARRLARGANAFDSPLGHVLDAARLAVSSKPVFPLERIVVHAVRWIRDVHGPKHAALFHHAERVQPSQGCRVFGLLSFRLLLVRKS
jgi:hypothetical protein